MNGQSLAGNVVKRNRLCVCRIDGDGLRLGGGVDGVAGEGPGLLYYYRPCDTGNADFAFCVCGVQPLGGQVAVGCVHIAALRVGQLKFYARQGLARQLIQLADNDSARHFVVEPERLYLALFDEDGLGRSVKHVALHSLDFTGGNCSTGSQVVNDDFAAFICDKLAIGVADNRPAGVRYEESYPFQRDSILRTSTSIRILFDYQSGAGGIVKREGLCIIGIYMNGLCPGCGVDSVAGNALGFGYDEGTHYAVNGDFSVLVCYIQSVAGDMPVGVRHELTSGGGDLEGNARQRLAGIGIFLEDYQTASFGVLHHNRLRVSARPDDHIGAGGINDVSAGRGLDFRQYISARREIGYLDFSLRVGGKDTVRGQGRCANYPVQPYLAACGGSDPELRTWKRLIGGAVPFLDNQLALWLILERQSDRAARFYLNGLRLRINEESRRSACLRYHHAFAGFQTGNADFTRLIGSENAV